MGPYDEYLGRRQRLGDQGLSEEDSGGQAFLIGLFLTIIILGTIVLIVKPDYRFEAISLTNEDYYSNVQVEKTKTPDNDDEEEDGNK